MKKYLTILVFHLNKPLYLPNIYFDFDFKLILFGLMYLYVLMNDFKRKQYASLEKCEPFLPLDIDINHVR